WFGAHGTPAPASTDTRLSWVQENGSTSPITEVTMPDGSTIYTVVKEALVQGQTHDAFIVNMDPAKGAVGITGTVAVQVHVEKDTLNPHTNPPPHSPHPWFGAHGTPAPASTDTRLSWVQENGSTS